MSQEIVAELQGLVNQLQTENASLKEKLATANRELINKDIHIGKIATEKTRAVGEVKSLKLEIERIREHCIDKTLFTNTIDKLVALLHKMRKTSDNSETRKSLQEFIEALNRTDEYKKKAQ